MSIELNNKGDFKSSFEIMPDREQTLIALTLAALARGKSEIRNFSIQEPFVSYIKFLKELGVEISEKTNDLIIDGIGLTKFNLPAGIIELSSIDYGMFLQCCLLRRDNDTFFYIVAPKFETKKSDKLKHFKKNILKHFNYEVLESESNEETICLKFLYEEIKAPKKIVNYIPFYQRTNLLLNSLINETELVFEEKNQPGDPLSRLLAFFDAPINIETIEEKDELAKRMAIVQGKKLERKFITTLNTIKALPSRSIILMGDTTQATLLSLLATIKPGSEITIKNVYTNPSKMALINALRRMGANIESKKKSTKQNDLSSDLVVKAAKLKGCKFTPKDRVCHDIYNIPSLAVAACFANGKTVIKLNTIKAKENRTYIEAIANNIKKADVEIGLFEEGLVIKGKEECKAAIYDANNSWALAYSLAVLASNCQGTSIINGFQNWNIEIPNTIEMLSNSNDSTNTINLEIEEKD